MLSIYKYTIIEQNGFHQQQLIGQKVLNDWHVQTKIEMENQLTWVLTSWLETAIDGGRVLSAG